MFGRKKKEKGNGPEGTDGRCVSGVDEIGFEELGEDVVSPRGGVKRTIDVVLGFGEHVGIEVAANEDDVFRSELVVECDGHMGRRDHGILLVVIEVGQATRRSRCNQETYMKCRGCWYCERSMKWPPWRWTGNKNVGAGAARSASNWAWPAVRSRPIASVRDT